MPQRLRRTLAIASAAAVLLAGAAPAGAVAGAEEGSPIIARPVPLLFTLLGLPLFLVAAPLSLAGGPGSVERAFESLVLSPARATVAPLPGSRPPPPSDEPDA